MKKSMLQRVPATSQNKSLSVTLCSMNRGCLWSVSCVRRNAPQRSLADPPASTILNVASPSTRICQQFDRDFGTNGTDFSICLNTRRSCVRRRFARGAIRNDPFQRVPNKPGWRGARLLMKAACRERAVARLAPQGNADRSHYPRDGTEKVIHEIRQSPACQRQRCLIAQAGHRHVLRKHQPARNYRNPGHRCSSRDDLFGRRGSERGGFALAD